jgi:hypothetical protein
MTTNTIRPNDRDALFQILLDDDARGLTLIHAAPIRTAEDFRRVRAELTRGRTEAGATLGMPARPR